MSEALIRKALEKHLALLPNGLATAHENVNFTPVVGQPFQSVNLLLSAPDDRGYGNEGSLQRGYLQVGLHYPTNTGAGAAQAKAEDIRKHFPRALSLPAGTFNVIIERTPEIMPGDVDDGRYSKFVRVRFFAQIDS